MWSFRDEFAKPSQCCGCAGTALLLADVVLNRARVTTHIVNAALNAAGSAATAIAC